MRQITMKKILTAFRFTIFLVFILSPINVSSSPRASEYQFTHLIIQKKNSILRIKIISNENKVQDTWEIEPRMLKTFITSNDCLEVDSDCNMSNAALKKTCSDPCLYEGPEFLTLDKTGKAIFFFNQLGVGGNGGASAMLFMADPLHKKIKKLSLTYTFISDTSLSPSGSVLAIALSPSRLAIQLIKILDGKSFEISIPEPSLHNAQKPYDVDKDPVYYIDTLHWLDETHLEFNEKKYPNKWANNPISNVKKTIEVNFNIGSGKIIKQG